MQRRDGSPRTKRGKDAAQPHPATRAFGTPDAETTYVAAAPSSKRRADVPLEPVPMVPIVRVHRPGARVQTRVGIGKYSIDHAAGLPLNQRASRPDFLRPESTRPEPMDPARSSAPRQLARDETPVVLPLQKTSRLAWIAVVLMLVPIVIWLLLALASNATPQP
jgi:hypothetical protein